MLRSSPSPRTARSPCRPCFTAKVAAERLVTAYALGYGFQTWIFRFVSLLGPRYSHGGCDPFIWWSSAATQKALHVLGDGHQKKSFLHVLDCCVRELRRAFTVSPAASRVNVMTDTLEVESTPASAAEPRRRAQRFSLGRARLGWGRAAHPARQRARSLARLMNCSPRAGFGRRASSRALRFMQANASPAEASARRELARPSSPRHRRHPRAVLGRGDIRRGRRGGLCLGDPAAGPAAYARSPPGRGVVMLFDRDRRGAGRARVRRLLPGAPYAVEGSSTAPGDGDAWSRTTNRGDRDPPVSVLRYFGHETGGRAGRRHRGIHVRHALDTLI